MYVYSLHTSQWAIFVNLGAGTTPSAEQEKSLILERRHIRCVCCMCFAYANTQQQKEGAMGLLTGIVPSPLKYLFPARYRRILPPVETALLAD